MGLLWDTMGDFIFLEDSHSMDSEFLKMSNDSKRWDLEVYDW